jgi:hypothetical protein
MVAPLVDPAAVADEVTTGTHARRYHRRTVQAPVALRLTDPAGKTLARGTAQLANLTPVGAWLVDLDLGGAGLPLADFRVALRVTAGAHAGLDAVCRPVHARFGRQRGLAVAFIHVRVSV